MVINQKGAFGPFILWEVEIKGGGEWVGGSADLVRRVPGILLYTMFEFKTYLL